MKKIKIPHQFRAENPAVGDEMFFSDQDIDDAFHSLRLHQGAFRIYFLGWEQQSEGANHS